MRLSSWPETQAAGVNKTLTETRLRVQSEDQVWVRTAAKVRGGLVIADDQASSVFFLKHTETHFNNDSTAAHKQ